MLNNIVTLKSGLGGSLKIVGSGTMRKLGYSFLYVFRSNYGCILYRFGDEARYWSKIAIFSYPLAFDAS